MNKEDKELLLQDLCARLPYGLYIQDEYGDIVYISYNDVHFANYFDSVLNGTIKPYLFPLSSMTEEQMFDFATVQAENCKGSYPTLSECSAIIDWGYKHHFDVNSLIEKGLAIDATGLNIY